MRKHDTSNPAYADSIDSGSPGLLIGMIGWRPRYHPYLSIREPGPEGKVLATIDNANALRGLARRILRSLDDD